MAFHRRLLGEHPEVMSTLEGERGHGKVDVVREVCVNFILQICSKCEQGGGCSKKPKILRMSLLDAPLAVGDC